MAQEHQEYIQTKVNPTLEALVTQVLLERPENPVPFMIHWLAEHTNSSVGAVSDGKEAERLKSEISELKAEIKDLEDRVRSSADAPAGVAGAKEDAESEEEASDEDPGELPPPPASYLNKGQRSSVSAEAFGEWNQRTKFEPPNHPKTDEQKTRIVETLSRSFLFNSLDASAIDILVGAMLEKVLEADQRIIEEGDDGDVLFIIEEGKLDCLKKIDGEEKVVKTCLPGDAFGELALLYNCPRAASVETKAKSVLWQLDRETFNAVVRDAAIERREKHVAFLKTVPLLESMDGYGMTQLADCLEARSFAAGKTVVTQGEIGDTVYLVAEGEAAVTKSGGEGEDGRAVMQLKAGGYFGELALLNDDTRAATITATSDLKVLCIDRKAFQRLLGPLQDIMKEKAKDYAT